MNRAARRKAQALARKARSKARVRAAAMFVKQVRRLVSEFMDRRELSFMQRWFAERVVRARITRRLGA